MRLSGESHPQRNRLAERQCPLNSRSQPRKMKACEYKEKEFMVPFDRITFDPNRLDGQPCVRNLRLTVRRVLEAMATYPDRDDLLREYPELEEKDLRPA